MEALRERILKQFVDLKKDTLDLHALFEAAGNDPQERRRVVEIVEALERAGLLESRGSDFYALTPQGKRAVRASGGTHP